MTNLWTRMLAAGGLMLGLTTVTLQAGCDGSADTTGSAADPNGPDGVGNIAGNDTEAAGDGAAAGDTSGQPNTDVTGPAKDTGGGPADTSPQVDTGAPAQPSGPVAAIYQDNPNDDSLVQVAMPHLSSDDGTLTGEFAKVWNCTQNAGGETMSYQGMTLTLCNQEQVAKTGADGTYLHIAPPALDTDGNDSFAELMMYYHLNVIHDYFRDGFGLKTLDLPLDALVNVQFSIAGFNSWLPFDNAAFIPKESLQMSGLPLDLKGDSVVFGQGTNVDFSYEADVIYHEYTHAMIGSTRLLGVTYDDFGPTNLPSGMNEGFADYFAATIADDPLMGDYALTNVQSMFVQGPPQDLSRDLSEHRVCPDDLTTEFHADGQIVGSAMWAIRKALGPELSDLVILRAILGFTNQTGLEDAAEAIIAEAAQLDPPRDAEVEAILIDHGMKGCNRVMPYKPFAAMGGSTLPIDMPGTATTGLMQFGKFVPGYVQWRYEVPSGKVGFKIAIQAASGGGFFGGGGEAANLSMLIKRGEEPIMYTYAGTKTTYDADVLIPLEAGTATGQGMIPYSATVLGDCVDSGPYVLQLHNTSKSGTQIYSFTITPLTTAPDGAAPTYSTCP